MNTEIWYKNIMVKKSLILANYDLLWKKRLENLEARNPYYTIYFKQNLHNEIRTEHKIHSYRKFESSLPLSVFSNKIFNNKIFFRKTSFVTF